MIKNEIDLHLALRHPDFEREIRDVAQIADLKVAFPHLVYAVLEYLCEHHQDFTRLITTVSDFDVLLETFPTEKGRLAKLFFDKTKLHIGILQKLSPSNALIALFDFKRKFPSKADYLKKYIFNSSIEFNRLVTNINEFHQVIAAFPDEKISALKFACEDLNTFTSLFTTLEDLRSILVNYISDVIENYQYEFIRLKFDRLFAAQSIEEARNALKKDLKEHDRLKIAEAAHGILRLTNTPHHSVAFFSSSKAYLVKVAARSRNKTLTSKEEALNIAKQAIYPLTGPDKHTETCNFTQLTEQIVPHLHKHDAYTTLQRLISTESTNTNLITELVTLLKPELNGTISYRATRATLAINLVLLAYIIQPTVVYGILRTKLYIYNDSFFERLFNWLVRGDKTSFDISLFPNPYGELPWYDNDSFGALLQSANTTELNFTNSLFFLREEPLNLAKLSQMLMQSSVKTLNLTNAGITPEIDEQTCLQLSVLIAVSGVKNLNVSNNKIGLLPLDFAERFFKSLLDSKVTSLDLRKNYLGEASNEVWAIFLEVIRKLRLKSLKLSGNNLTPMQLTKLASTLMPNTTLRLLDLSQQKMTEETHQSFIDLLIDNDTLNQINMPCPGLS